MKTTNRPVQTLEQNTAPLEFYKTPTWCLASRATRGTSPHLWSTSGVVSHQQCNSFSGENYYSKSNLNLNRTESPFDGLGCFKILFPSSPLRKTHHPDSDNLKLGNLFMVSSAIRHSAFSSAWHLYKNQRCFISKTALLTHVIETTCDLKYRNWIMCHPDSWWFATLNRLNEAIQLIKCFLVTTPRENCSQQPLGAKLKDP